MCVFFFFFWVNHHVSWCAKGRNTTRLMHVLKRHLIIIKIIIVNEQFFSNFLSAKTISFIYGEDELYKSKVIKTFVTRKVIKYG